MNPELLEFLKYVGAIASVAYVNVMVVKSEIQSLKSSLTKLDERVWNVAIGKDHLHEKSNRAA